MFASKEERFQKACEKGKIDNVKKILEKNPEFLNASLNRYGWRALHYSADGKMELMKFLLESGAEVEATNSAGTTALHQSAMHGKTEAMKLLLEKGASVHVASKDDSTPLHLAAGNGKIEAVKLLIEAGANINVLTKNKWTPLHYASHNGYTDIAELLLSSGADIETATTTGKKAEAFEYTSQSTGQAEIKKMIKKERKRREKSSVENQQEVGPSAPSTSQHQTIPMQSGPSIPPPQAQQTTPSDPPSKKRTDDVGLEDLNNNIPIKGVWETPLMSFTAAVHHTEIPDLEGDIASCIEFFEYYEDPPPMLTMDEACAIRFYTLETDLYPEFNKALRSRDRKLAKVFFPFLQLLLLAMHKMPKSSGTLFRGTRNLPSSVLNEYIRKADSKKCVFWSACSSTTTNVATLSNPAFCGTQGNRTRFVIQNCDMGVDIEALSAMGYEKEVLLPPCLRFAVESYVDLGHGLLEFQLKYSSPTRDLLELVPPPEFLSVSS